MIGLLPTMTQPGSEKTAKKIGANSCFICCCVGKESGGGERARGEQSASQHKHKAVGVESYCCCLLSAAPYCFVLNVGCRTWDPFYVHGLYLAGFNRG